MAIPQEILDAAEKVEAAFVARQEAKSSLQAAEATVAAAKSNVKTTEEDFQTAADKLHTAIKNRYFPEPPV